MMKEVEAYLMIINIIIRRRGEQETIGIFYTAKKDEAEKLGRY